MVVIPAGTFIMGSPATEEGRFADEGPQHPVAIAKPFAMSALPVTVDQFSEFVAESGYRAGSECYTLLDGNWSEPEGRFWRHPGFAQSGERSRVVRAAVLP